MLVAMTLQPFEVMPSLCCLSDTAFRRRSKTSYFLQKKNIAPHFITIFLHRITRIELLVAFLSGKSFLYLNFLWTKANSLHFERTVAKSRKIPPTHFQPMHHPRLSRFRQAGWQVFDLLKVSLYCLNCRVLFGFQNFIFFSIEVDSNLYIMPIDMWVNIDWCWSSYI